MAQSFLNEDELYVPEDIIKEARSVKHCGVVIQS
jgi:hypothetical protein